MVERHTPRARAALPVESRSLVMLQSVDAAPGTKNKMHKSIWAESVLDELFLGHAAGLSGLRSLKAPRRRLLGVITRFAQNPTLRKICRSARSFSR